MLVQVVMASPATDGNSRLQAVRCSRNPLAIASVELDTLLNVGVCQEGGVGNANVVVDVEEVRRVCARDSFFWEGAREGQLVEDRLVAAEEAVLLDFCVAIRVIDDVAHVEDLAVVVHVGEVAVPSLALESCLYGAHDKFHTIWEFVGSTLAPSLCNHCGFWLRFLHGSSNCDDKNGKDNGSLHGGGKRFPKGPGRRKNLKRSSDTRREDGELL